jgi:gliding motility-associated-like protein
MVRIDRYIMILWIMLIINFHVIGQMSMPDYPFVGQTGHYHVDPNPATGSTYSWRINGVVQAGFNTNEFDHTWITEGTYTVEVQELSADGCQGPVRSGQVFVSLFGMNKICLTIPEAISPNRDLINDVWNIENTELYPQMEITIYNRWGQTVWKSEKGYPVPWDGRSRGKELPVDSYHYIIDLHNGLKPIIGAITLIR